MSADGQRIERTPAFRWACLAMLLSASTQLAWADPAHEARRGLQALDEQDFDAAVSAFQAGLKQAIEANDERWQARLHFYLGLTRQEQVDASAQPNSKQALALLREAQERYESAVRFAPASGGAWNNMAQVCARLGDDEQAATAFQKAIAVADDRQALYTLGYAEFVEKSDPDKARRFLYLALEQEPQNERIHERLIGWYAAHAQERIGEYTWWLHDHGQTGRALGTSLRLLDEPERPQEPRELLLTCAVTALSELEPSRRKFLDGESVRPWRALLDRPELSQPISEILLLFETAPADLHAERFPWWRERVPTERDAPAPPRGWPQEAFTSLVRALGETAEREEGGREEAAHYYLLAYGLSPELLDAKALVKLIDLWIRSGQRSRIAEFLEREEYRLFHDKNRAILAMNFRRMYDFHRALGIIYAELERWGSSGRAGSALFQLEHALDSARRVNSQSLDGQGELLVEPQLVELLARGYLQTDDGNRAFELRVTSAEYYRSLGNTRAAAEVFEPVKTARPPARLKPEIRQSYERLQQAHQQGTFHIPERASDSRTEPANRMRVIDAADGATIRMRLPADRRAGVPPERLERVADSIEALTRRRRPTANGGRRYQWLPRELPDEIQEVEFDGKRGHIAVADPKKPANQTQKIPFSVDKASKVEGFRYVRP